MDHIAYDTNVSLLDYDIVWFTPQWYEGYRDRLSWEYSKECNLHRKEEIDSFLKAGKTLFINMKGYHDLLKLKLIMQRI